MRSPKLFLTGILLTLSAATALGADIVVAPAPAPQVAVQEPSCLRWVWQELAWYNDCWWQREPYVGRAVGRSYTLKR